MNTNTDPVVLTNDDSMSWVSWDHETEGKAWSNGGQQPLPPGAANSDSQNCYYIDVRNNTAGPGRPSSSPHYVAPGSPPHFQNNSGERQGQEHCTSTIMNVATTITPILTYMSNSRNLMHFPRFQQIGQRNNNTMVLVFII